MAASTGVAATQFSPIAAAAHTLTASGLGKPEALISGAFKFAYRAKSVEYVKVCSLYGAGFYYIPGTDTCLKIGGYVRAEWLHNAGGSFAPWNNAGAGPNSTRFTLTDSNDLQSRNRGVATPSMHARRPNTARCVRTSRVASSGRRTTRLMPVRARSPILSARSSSSPASPSAGRSRSSTSSPIRSTATRPRRSARIPAVPAPT